MRLIKQSYSYLPQSIGIGGMYRNIELAGRTSYKSEDKITDCSAIRFVEMLSMNEHFAPLEFGTVYLKYPIKLDYTKYELNPYSEVRYMGDTDYFAITTNYRVLVENEWLDDLKYWCEPTKYFKQRLAVKLITSLQVSHELVRHRSMSFMQESTRFCNYSKDKFSNELSFILPSRFIENYESGVSVPPEYMTWSKAMGAAEVYYMQMIKLGCKPQEAAGVLPKATKTELCICGFIDQWRALFSLRCSTKALPATREICIAVETYFKDTKLMDNNGFDYAANITDDSKTD